MQDPLRMRRLNLLNFLKKEHRRDESVPRFRNRTRLRHRFETGTSSLISVVNLHNQMPSSRGQQFSVNRHTDSGFVLDGVMVALEKLKFVDWYFDYTLILWSLG